MSTLDRTTRKIAVFLILFLGLLMGVLATIPGALAQSIAPSGPQAPTNFDSPTSSSPIVMSADKSLIWVVNPDDDSVSVIGNLDTSPVVLTRIEVGDEPRSLALDTNNIDPTIYRVYVADAADNGITILNVTSSSSSSVTAIVENPLLVTGAEPWDVVASPDGRRIFVANSGQDTITVIRTDTRAIVGSVDLRNSLCNVGDANRHFQPRGLAVTLASDRLYVARFLSFTRTGGVQGNETGKQGVVCQLNIPVDLATLPSVATVTTLAARNTGFTIDRDNNGTPDPTSAFPNQLQSIVIRGNQAYLPNIAASPSGPLKFNVDTQAFVNVMDNAASGPPTDASATKFLNLHRGARDPEPGKKKLFFSNPWAMAFTNQSGSGNAYVVSAGSDLLVKLNVNASGVLTHTVSTDTTRYIDLNNPADPATSGANAGKNPLGIVIRNIGPGNNKAYVMNYVSRNVSVVNLDTDAVVSVIQVTALPPAGSQDEQLQVGKEVFFSSRGHFDDPGGATVSLDNRLSSEGWQSCASCHFNGLTDGVIWAFGAGPRKSVPMNGTWSPQNPDDQRLLNYSAIFDEVQDFELNIRNISGPGFLPTPAPPNTLDPNHGLLIADNGDVNSTPSTINAFTRANAGRPQHTVTLPGSTTAWPALDALKEWVRFAIRTPNGALTTTELGVGNPIGGLNPTDVTLGRRLFFQAGCHTCHGGTKWSLSHKDFISPPAIGEIAAEVGAAGVVGAQYLDRFLSDIGSFNLGVAGAGNPIDGDVGAVERSDTGLIALGIDHNADGKGAGYNIPSLLGVWNLPPYYHNGACETLSCVLSNIPHRTAGLRLGQSDPLLSPTSQANVVEWLKSLDADSEFPFNLSVTAHDIFIDPPTVFKGTQVVVGANISLFGTRTDLLNLASDLGLAGIKVRFTLEPSAGSTTVDTTLPLAAFNQDFGQAVITTTWDVPLSATSLGRIRVDIDPDLEFPESQETDNGAQRTVLIRTSPPDTTPPVVSSVAINDNAAITDSRSAAVKIVAVDPAGPGGETISGVGSYCLVSYTFSIILRRWVEEPCQFLPLPPPETGTTDTFVVNKTLQPQEGVEYAFAWIKDNAGNISRTPGFDVITFIPLAPISLNRNGVTILRIPLLVGQSITFTFTPNFGDVDATVFDDFTNPNANRIAVSAHRSITPESVTITGPGRFQIEIRAIINSRYTISFIQTASGATFEAAPGDGGFPPFDPAVLADKPVVAGPPALRTAIDVPIPLYLPLTLR